jgi:hypothetical protein
LGGKGGGVKKSFLFFATLFLFFNQGIGIFCYCICCAGNDKTLFEDDETQLKEIYIDEMEMVETSDSQTKDSTTTTTTAKKKDPVGQDEEEENLVPLRVRK